MPNDRRVTAVLGPTNTGKTFLAVERMLGHSSGMIGFPLRLLARENYDRIVAAKGARAVALVTGEEKIVPPNARYIVCTVESMPLDRPVDFLAIDEVQMAADPERGHVFTDRILHARGMAETMLLGADIARPLIRDLVPGVEFVARPRFSRLTYTGPCKVTRLPPRTAVVAFSAAEVYRIAELVRRQRGGTAVVLGALSPRARNAQVGMYQAGEVDYLVATDAIGMGLNMDVRHVAFSGLSKYDGRDARRLVPAEVAQIAGRAGRHMRDGTFGTTAELGGMDEELVARLEEHRFEPLQSFQWRSRSLDFRSIEALERSLQVPPPHPRLQRARPAEDELHLAALALDPDVRGLANGRPRIELLWEVAQVPDFRKTLTDAHVRLLARIYGHLARPPGRLPADWVAAQIAAIARTDGEIDALMARIAATRTWTYITHRAGWLDDPAHWQERARAIEDELSDALHQRLTQRFVDRRAAHLVQRLRDGGELIGGVTADGNVVIEGHHVGRLHGFRFEPDTVALTDDARPLMNAAQRVLRSEIDGRIARLTADADTAFSLDAHGQLSWRGQPVARLAAGRTPLAPRAEPFDGDLIDGSHRRAIRDRAEAWLKAHVADVLAPLERLMAAASEGTWSGAARGLAFQLAEAFGLLPRPAVAAQVASLTAEDRKQLARLGVRLGTETIYVPAVAKGRARKLASQLWALHQGRLGDARLEEARVGPAPVPDVPEGYYGARGLRVFGGAALPPDRLERLAQTLRRLAHDGPITPAPALAEQAGVPPEALPPLLRALGYRQQPGEAGPVYVRKRGRRGPPPQSEAAASSPFAGLRALLAAG